MNLANKTYKNNTTGEVIKIIDSFGDIAVLENKNKVNVTDLMDTSKYTEQIDPSSFFNNQSAYDGLVEKIKTLPTDNMIDESVSQSFGGDEFKPTMSESAIIQTTEEDEIAELARKYGVNQGNTNEVESQNDAFNKILNPEKPEIKPKRQNQLGDNEPTNTSLDERRGEIIYEEPKVADNPILVMFKSAKKNVDMDIKIESDVKIPRLDFIEMMEDSYDVSIIDFLSEEITNQLLEDTESIKEKVKLRIKEMVYGEDYMKSSKKEGFSENIEDSTKDVKAETVSKKNRKPSVKNRIDNILKLDSIDDINKLLKGEKSKNVISSAKKRIKELKESK